MSAWQGLTLIVLFLGVLLIEWGTKWPESCRKTCAPRLVQRATIYGICDCAPLSTAEARP